MTKKTITIIIIVIILAIAAVGAYWYFMSGQNITEQKNDTTTNNNNAFAPIDRPNTGNNTTTDGGTKTTQTPQPSNTQTPAKIPTLRMLSDTPVGGFGTSLTATTTIIRWIDRGRGNIYETRNDSTNVTTISNTILPRIYESKWNKDASSFIGYMLESDGSEYSTLYAELKPRTENKKLSTSTTTIETSSASPFELKGKNLPNNTITYAVSPKKDKLFIFVVEGEKGIGYISTFDGKKMSKLFETPLTQINSDWPTEDTIIITTKGEAEQNGYAYSVNTKTGVWKKIIDRLPGLTTKMSHDGKYMIISASGNNGDILTSIFDITKSKGTDAIIKTLVDKCVWGNFYKNIVYCAVPSNIPEAAYPDDWYRGAVSFTDKIWQINASTGEIHLISTIVDNSDRLIDAINLGLDEKDNNLIFMNKNDLSLWSLDLVTTAN